MRLNDVGRITFRFTPREISAMLKLLGVETLPGTGIFAATPEDDIQRSLIGDGIVIRLADRVLLDRTVKLILKSCTESTRRIEAAGLGGRVVLYAGAQICVMAVTRQTMVTLEPFQSAAQARQPFEAEAALMGAPVKLSVYQEGQCEGESDAPEMICAFLDKFCET